jgi:hypothetical protein
MTTLRKLILDVYDIRTAVRAAREYSVLAALPRDARRARLALPFAAAAVAMDSAKRLG